jgi:hypothetical protein
MRQCLICEKPLKWVKFKASDGYVCKRCYEVVSISFSQIITHKTKNELLEIYAQRTRLNELEVFEKSRAISQLILFDDTHQKLCLPNHPRYTKTPLNPEYYDYSELVDYQLIMEQNVKKIDKREKIVGTIEIQFFFEHNISRSILLIPNPIQIGSMSYKTMKSLAQKIISELNVAKKNSNLLSRVR